MWSFACAVMTVPLAPLLFVARVAPCRDAVEADAAAWRKPLSHWPPSRSGDLVWRSFLFWRMREFRSLLYARLSNCGIGWRLVARILAVVYRPQVSLHIDCREIGPGLFFEHGFSTVITAERIGARCWINQQVTIGYGPDHKRPTLGDDVSVRAGAVVIGGVTVADGCHIGANAVLAKSTAPGAVMAGVPAEVVRQSDAAASG